MTQRRPARGKKILALSKRIPPLCLCASVVAVAAFLGCAGAGRETVRVAAAGPMTGEQAKQGQDVYNAVVLCAEEWNARGGVLGRPVEVLSGDDAQDPKQAVALANKLYTQGVLVVIGHNNSSCTIPASEVYHQHNMVMVTPASTNPKVTDRGYPTVFRICGRDDQQGRFAAGWVVAKKPGAKVAVLHDKTTYGQGLADQFRSEHERLSGKPAVAYDAIVKEDQDYRSVLTRVSAQGPDLIYYGGLYPQAGLLRRQMKELGVQADFMSGDGAIDQEFIKIAGPENAIGTYATFAADQSRIPAARAVLKKYTSRFGEPGPHSLYAYASLNMALEAMEKAGKPDGRKTAEVMHGTAFDTILGNIEWDAKGDVLQSPFVMWRVEGGRFVQLPDSGEGDTAIRRSDRR
jgi:branched-chain amino acid transport system substrate-binding protein